MKINKIFAIIVSIVLFAGCQYETELQTKRRKEFDRNNVTQGRRTVFYSEHDPVLWDNSSYEPKPSLSKSLDGNFE